MGNFCEKDIIAMIQLTDDASYNAGKLEEILSPQAMANPHMQRLRRGDIFLQDGFPADHVYMLLRGTARVLVYSHSGKMAVVEAVPAPHIFGVTEAIGRMPIYGASVQASTAAVVAKLTKSEYLKVIYGNQESANITIHYLALLAIRNMDKSELKATTQPFDILLRYLYLQAKGHKLPYTVEVTRKTIADELHINLRTLYRYLNRLEEQGFVEHRHAKLVITQSAFYKLHDECLKIDIQE